MSLIPALTTDLTTFNFSVIENPGRVTAMVNTFNQTLQWAPADLAPSDLAGAFNTLSAPRDGDSPPVAARRATCKLLASALAEGNGVTFGDGRKAVEYFDNIVRALSLSEDPRHKAMYNTAAREAAELAG